MSDILGIGSTRLVINEVWKQRKDKEEETEWWFKLAQEIDIVHKRVSYKWLHMEPQ